MNVCGGPEVEVLFELEEEEDGTGTPRKSVNPYADRQRGSLVVSIDRR